MLQLLSLLEETKVLLLRTSPLTEVQLGPPVEKSGTQNQIIPDKHPEQREEGVLQLCEEDGGKPETCELHL